MKKNTYKEDGKNKVIARKEMVQAIYESDATSGKILTLPNSNWLIEQMIMSEVSSKFHFVAVECHKPTYYKMLKKMMELELDNVTTHRGFLGDFMIGQPENAYKHIIADYCGTLKKAAKELQYALEHKIVEVDGTISITLNERIVKKAGLSFERKTIKGYPKRKSHVVRCEHQLRCFVDKFGKDNFEIETVLRYTDKKKSGKGAHMILMVLRRVQ